MMYFSTVEEAVIAFSRQTSLDHRYASFDYCYNYFFKTDDLFEDLEKSCLELGFYLASWGMFRGSSFLLQKSLRYFIPVIEYIAKLDKNIWKIDVDSYNNQTINTILDIYRTIDSIIIPEVNRGITLTTKIMLGVFGIVPAFDEYFCAAFRTMANGKNGNPKCGFRSVNRKSLLIIKQFYEENKKTIDKLSNDIHTKDFFTGNISKVKYTKAKIIDMFGFIYGQNM